MNAPNTAGEFLLEDYLKPMCIANMQKNPQIQATLKQNNAGFRKVPGTTLKNQDDDIIYTPPQDQREIDALMADLEKFINSPELSQLDPALRLWFSHQTKNRPNQLLHQSRPHRHLDRKSMILSHAVCPSATQWLTDRSGFFLFSLKVKECKFLERIFVKVCFSHII